VEKDKKYKVCQHVIFLWTLLVEGDWCGCVCSDYVVLQATDASVAQQCARFAALHRHVCSLCQIEIGTLPSALDGTR
jgi:hypothetical protein